MMEVEHKLNIKIAQLKIKKLELEIAVLQTKRNSSTEWNVSKHKNKMLNSTL